MFTSMYNFIHYKKIIFFVIFCLTAFLLTGCWDRKEVNDSAFITIAGIDKKNDETLELSVNVNIPKSGVGQQGGSGNQEVLVRSAEGTTIADALSKLQQQFPRRLFWGHTTVFIIDQELAKDGVSKEMDFIIRHPQVRDRINLFISKQKVKEILSLTPPLERDLAEVLRELSKLKIGMNVTIKDFAQMTIRKPNTAILPYIEILPSESEKKTIAYITGSAILKKGKMMGHVNIPLTRGILWLRNEIKFAVVTVTPSDTKGHISFQLLRAHSKLVPKIKNDQWTITLKAKTEDDIIQNNTNLDLMNPLTIKMLERELKEDIINRVNESLDVIQKDMQVDIFGFGEAFHHEYPDIWRKNKERWDEIFPNVEVTIETEASVKRPGMITVPSLIPEEDVEK